MPRTCGKTVCARRKKKETRKDENLPSRPPYPNDPTTVTNSRWIATKPSLPRFRKVNASAPVGPGFVETGLPQLSLSEMY